VRTTNSPPEPASELEFCLRHSDPGPSVSLKTGLARKIQNGSLAHADEVCLAECVPAHLSLVTSVRGKDVRSGIELRQKGPAVSFQRVQTDNLLTLTS